MRSGSRGMDHYHRKPTNRNLPEKISTVVPEAKLYSNLQDAERRLDATIARKKLDLQDALARSSTKSQLVRVFVSNTVADQPWQGSSQVQDAPFDFENGPAPSWTLRVEGRVVEDATGNAATTTTNNNNNNNNDDNNNDGKEQSQGEDQEKSGEEKADQYAGRRMFSSFFTAIIVELQYEDEADIPSEGAIVEWHEPVPGTAAAANATDFDCLEVRRKGDRSVKAKIQLQPKEYPTKFRLSPQLASLLAIEEDTKAGVVVALWQYIRFHQLQDRDEKRLIKCDAPLRALFGGREALSFPQIMELLAPHLQQRPPITLEYEVRVDQAGVSLPAEAWDIMVEVPDPARQQLAQVLESWASSQGETADLDEQIALTVESLYASQLKRDFFDQLARDPAAFTQRWVQSQARDLQVLLSDRKFSEEEARHSSFYTDELLGNTIQYFLSTGR